MPTPPWGDDPEIRRRIYAKIAPRIMEFHACHAGQLFHVEELRVFVCDWIPEIAPDSPGRILRALRLEGRLDYIILNRRASLYQFTTGWNMQKLTIPQVRHCLLALATTIEGGGEITDLPTLLRYLAEQTRRAPRSTKDAITQEAAE